jgi:selenocysteine-specific elongation factor
MPSHFNINCGVLGHVDSGKTSICRCIHHVASTASMDKHPQSQERGITLDLGFSSFTVTTHDSSERKFQFTLVDCPGHASLIKSVIGAAQIIDLCLLVIDAQKGFQAQTVECLIISEIVTHRLIIVVNKIDMIEESSRQARLHDMQSRIRKAMAKTRFGSEVPIAFISATKNEGMGKLIQLMVDYFHTPPVRMPSGPLHLAFDHCFTAKGQGTVITGTIISGKLSKGDKISIPEWGETGEVRSIQAFRQPVESAQQGDRVGVCIPGINPMNKERGDIYSFNNVDLFRGTRMICLVRKIRHFKAHLKNIQLQINFGHQHSMAQIYFIEPVCVSDAHASTRSEPSISLGTGPILKDLDMDLRSAEALIRDRTTTFKLVEDIDPCLCDDRSHLCIVLFDRKVTCLSNSIMIGSRLDVDPENAGCRIALYGRHVSGHIDDIKNSILKQKVKTGIITRTHDNDFLLVKGLLKKDGGDPSKVIGNPITHEPSGTKGFVDSTFGKSGLVKVRFRNKINANIDDKVIMNVQKPALLKIIDSHDRTLSR